MDELGLTYYLMDYTFMIKDPGVVTSDFNQVFALVGSVHVYLQEAGYSTSGDCGGSFANQSAFVDQIFSVWDTHSSQMPFVSFLRMNDLSLTDAESTASGYGLGTDTAFIAYLQTLGFRTYNSPSTNKPALIEVRNQTQLRGW